MMFAGAPAASKTERSRHTQVWICLSAVIGEASPQTASMILPTDTILFASVARSARTVSCLFLASLTTVFPTFT